MVSAGIPVKVGIIGQHYPELRTSSEFSAYLIQISERSNIWMLLREYTRNALPAVYTFIFAGVEMFHAISGGRLVTAVFVS